MKRRYNKKILVITHQLSRTGAPVVLLDMIAACRKQGYQIDVISMLEGELRDVLEAQNIQVEIQEHFIDDVDGFYERASKYDMVIANTLITYEVIHILNGSAIPVLWWLHEGKQYFEYFASVLPDFHRLGANIHVFSVGHYVQDVIREKYGYETPILHFGVRDVPRKKMQAHEGTDKVRFLTAGTYSKVKAQDVLVEAIRMLSEDMLAQSEFFFCGNETMYDEEIYRPVKDLSLEYENVHMLGQLSHDDTLERMEQCECLLVPSRIDPIPTVAVEVMMKERICLCTDVCGVAHYIEDAVNGYTVPPEDVSVLAAKIEYVITHREEWERVEKAGRKIYEEHFSMEVFEPMVLKLADEYMYPEERQMKELAQCIRQIRCEVDQGLVLSQEESEQIENSVAVLWDYVQRNYEVDGSDEEWLTEFGR